MAMNKIHYHNPNQGVKSTARSDSQKERLMKTNTQKPMGLEPARISSSQQNVNFWGDLWYQHWPLSQIEPGQ